MYQSLYRTWRPKTFSQMVGQPYLVRTLMNQAVTGHIAHAYLFSGSRGTGKTSAARILAMAINCRNLQGGDPCLSCTSCQALLTETTLDIFEMDAASNSRVEEIREMLEKVNYPPQFVRFKVYIIDEVHMLSNAAFNALLKTLEEPPSYMVFILATTEPQKIPATILSRCQRFEFGRIREQDIISRLKVALKPGQLAEEAALELIAVSAEGSMRDAWSLMDMCLDEDGDLSEERVRQALGAVDKGFMFGFVQALAQGDAAQAFGMISQMMQSGKDVQVFLKDAAAHLRRVIAAKLDPQGTGESNDDMLSRYRAQSQDIPLDKLIWILDKAVKAEGDLRWVSQQRTVLEVFALTVCQPDQESDAQSLRVRVTDLERQLSSFQTSQPPQRERKPTPKRSEQPRDTASESRDEDMTPAEAAVSADDADSNAISPKDAWNAMLKRAAHELPSVYSMMSEGKFGGYKDGCFYLSFPDDRQYLVSFIMDEGRRSQIEAILSQVYGQTVLFKASRAADPQRESDQRQKAQQDIDLLTQVFGRQNLSVKNEL